MASNKTNRVAMRHPLMPQHNPSLADQVPLGSETLALSSSAQLGQLYYLCLLSHVYCRSPGAWHFECAKVHRFFLKDLLVIPSERHHQRLRLLHAVRTCLHEIVWWAVFLVVR
jgi:hypothetical protein